MKLNGFSAFVLFSIIMLVLDSVYLNSIAGEFGKMIGKIQGSKMEVNMMAAAVVYVALVLAWYTFIYPNIGEKDLKDVLCKAFILGLCIYATYDFTNMAIIKGYRLDLSVIDSVWGGVLYATSTYLYVFISSLV
tara:strand:- start:43 stop:444 length:402 start_codon:yes stop_codon:yes gene_type:complete